MIRKATLLTMAAIAAALLVPAMSHAEEAKWTMHGEALEEDMEVFTTGTGKWIINGAETICEEHLRTRTTWYQFFSGKAHTWWEVTKHTCQREKWMKVLCTGASEFTVEYPEAEIEGTLPTQAENNEGVRTAEIKAAILTIKLEGGGLCPKEVTGEGSVTLTPDDHEAMTSYSLSGSFETNLGAVTMTGTQELTKDPETFGIE